MFFLFFNIASCSSFEGEKAGAGKIINRINGEPVLPQGANKIIIPFFRNFTDVHSITERLTLRTRELVNMEGRLTVVSDQDEADLRLDGKAVLYHLQPVQYSSSGEVVRKRLRIVVSIRLFDLKRDREILYERSLQAFEVFSEVIPPVESETTVRDRVIENLARRISVKIVTGWYTDLMSNIEKGKK